MNYYQKYLKYKKKYLINKYLWTGELTADDLDRLTRLRGGSLKCKNNISNVSVVIINKSNNNQILLLRDKKNKDWMTPGGGVKNEDLQNTNHPCWKALLREYFEETGNSLPNLTNIKSFDYHDHTRIYIGIANPSEIKFKNTNETDAYMWIALDDLKNNKFPIKNYVKKSIELLISNKLL